MESQQQERQSDKRRGQRYRGKLSLLVRWMIAIAVLFLIVVGATFWILNSKGPLATIISIIFVALSLVFSFFQVFPSFFSTRKHDLPTEHVPSQPTHIVVHVHPSSLSSQQSLSAEHVTSSTKSEISSAIDSQSPLQLDQPAKDPIEPKLYNLHREDWGEAPNVEQFYGREQELAELEQRIVGDHCRLVALLGLAGIGKTALTAKLAEQIKDRFTFVLWRSLQNAPPLESILKNCIQFFSNQQQTDLPEDVNDQISLLVEYLRDHRCLMVLDNLETILQAGNRTGFYREGYGGYGTLIQRIGEAKHQSCLLLTSREKPKELVHLEGKTSPVYSLLLPGLDQEKGQELLKDKGLFGSHENWAAFIHLYSGNPLALKMASEAVREVFGGDIIAFLSRRKAVFGDIRDPLAIQFTRLSKLEKEIIYWLAIEREAVSLEDLRADIVHPIPEGELLEAVGSLRRRSLIEISSLGYFNLQPVIMEYVIDQFIEEIAGEIEKDEMKVFMSHALIKAQAKDYIRDSQVRIILTPIAEQLFHTLGKAGVEKKLKRILSALRKMQTNANGYAAGNVLNLLVNLSYSLRGYDFSYLIVRQAYLPEVALPNVNFAHADLATSVFPDKFGSVLSVALNPTGELLAAGTTDSEIRIWQVPSSVLLLTCQGHSGWVWSVAFSPDGRVLASGSDDQTVRLWDVSTGQCLHILYEHSNWIRSVAFSPDGRVLASGSEDQTVRLWDVSTGQCLHILRGHVDRIRSVVFSSDGTIIASGSQDQTVRLWDVRTGQCLKTLYGHSSLVGSVAFNHDSRLLASGSSDQTVRLWDVRTGQCLMILHGHTNRIRSVAFHPDGTKLASGSEDQAVRLWDVSTGHCLHILNGHSSWIRSVAFSSDGSMLVSGSEDQTVRLWDVSTGQCLKTLHAYINWVYSVAFSPDGTMLASGNEDKTVRLWETETGQCATILQGHTKRVRSVAFSPNGNMLASGSDDQTVRLWDLSTNQCIRILHGHTNRVWSVAFSPDSRLVVSGSDDKTVRLWNVNSGHCLMTLQGDVDRVWSVAISLDGKFLASGNEDHTVRLWDASTGKRLYTFNKHRDRVRSVAFSFDARFLASGSHDKTVCLWDTSSWQELVTLQSDDIVRTVCFNPTGKLLAYGSGNAVWLWEVSSGQTPKLLHEHTNRIWSTAFSPRESILASAGEDGTIKLWDLQSGKCLNTLVSDKPYEHMNITNVAGLTEAQKATLKALGAIEK